MHLFSALFTLMAVHPISQLARRTPIKEVSLFKNTPHVYYRPMKTWSPIHTDRTGKQNTNQRTYWYCNSGGAAQVHSSSVNRTVISHILYKSGFSTRVGSFFFFNFCSSRDRLATRDLKKKNVTLNTFPWITVEYFWDEPKNCCLMVNIWT